MVEFCVLKTRTTSIYFLLYELKKANALKTVPGCWDWVKKEKNLRHSVPPHPRPAGRLQRRKHPASPAGFRAAAPAVGPQH